MCIRDRYNNVDLKNNYTMDEEEIIMSYTEEVYERVVAQNPNEPEFHQAVKELYTPCLLYTSTKMKRNTASFPFWNVLLSLKESSLSEFPGLLTDGILNHLCMVRSHC